VIETSCLNCGSPIEIDMREGVRYFFGYDTGYYSEAGEDRDPHEVVGYYCKTCGENLRERAKGVGR